MGIIDFNPYLTKNSTMGKISYHKQYTVIYNLQQTESFLNKFPPLGLIVWGSNLSEN